MLAQNFKTAAELGISEEKVSALCKTLALMDSGNLKLTEESPVFARKLSFSGQFNMNQWSASNKCGTIACIGGTAEIVGNVKFTRVETPQLHSLFYPRLVKGWSAITVEQAAIALRSYLTTGDARWDLALAQ